MEGELKTLRLPTSLAGVGLCSQECSLELRTVIKQGIGESSLEGRNFESTGGGGKAEGKASAGVLLQS